MARPKKDKSELKRPLNYRVDPVLHEHVSNNGKTAYLEELIRADMISKKAELDYGGQVFVLMTMNDIPANMPSGEVYFDSDGPLVHGQYAHNSQRECVIERAKVISKQYGTTRIARLVFENEEY